MLSQKKWSKFNISCITSPYLQQQSTNPVIFWCRGAKHKHLQRWPSKIKQILLSLPKYFSFFLQKGNVVFINIKDILETSKNWFQHKNKKKNPAYLITKVKQQKPTTKPTVNFATLRRKQFYMPDSTYILYFLI